MEQEIWRDIPGYEGRYQVSNYGRVLDVPNNKYLKEKVHQSRHIVILYGKKELSLNKLVYCVFVNNTNKVVYNIDGNPYNHYYKNLNLGNQHTGETINNHYVVLDESFSNGKYKYTIQCNICKDILYFSGHFNNILLRKHFKCSCYYKYNVGDVILNNYLIKDKYIGNNQHYVYKVHCQLCGDDLVIKNIRNDSKFFMCSCNKNRKYKVGKVYNNLLVLDKRCSDLHSERYLVKCLKCGKERWSSSNVFKSKSGFKCICNSAVRYNVGDIVKGSYTVIKVKERTGHGNKYDLICNKCGDVLYNKSIHSKGLRCDSPYKCSCLQPPSYIDGRSRKRTYKIWWGIKCRCNNNIKYGGKSYKNDNIFMCKFWGNSFDNFDKWYEEQLKNYSLDNFDIPDWVFEKSNNAYIKRLLSPAVDRIDPRYEYAPYNCQIIPGYINSYNKRVSDIKRTPIQLKIDDSIYNRRKKNWIKQMVKYGYKEEDLI